MTTDAQIQANRENSRKSTGPKTDETKAISSLNSRTHGFSAVDPVLPTENRDEFNALLEDYKTEWEPETPHQEFLLREMTGARWKLNRLERMEVEMFAALDDLTKAFKDKETAAAFARLERYRAALQRNYHRCARELRADMFAEAALQNEANSAQAAEDRFMELLNRLYQGPSDEHLRTILAEHRAKHPAAEAADGASGAADQPSGSVKAA